MDGLVAVDLDQTSPRLLSLYMGADNYDRFRRQASRLAPSVVATSASL